MKRITVVSLAFALPLLSGCVVEPYDASYNRGGYYAPRPVVVHVNDHDDRYDHGDRGYHCPPGQAKKGNC